ncbi:MAG: hypothetical protein AUH72_19300 [Acidobacteria bacterium 13_1_40CM_4_65_8]|nr:MAG: hypothetical protein AUH72_19300 [Acidobacteria bacterium 13_1_40CM_4_65_8]
MMFSPVLRSTIVATVSGFLTRPCCVIPAAMSMTGIGTARLSGALVSHRAEFLMTSALLLGASVVINFRREGGVFNKAMAIAASMVAFSIAAGWVGGL